MNARRFLISAFMVLLTLIMPVMALSSTEDTSCDASNDSSQMCGCIENTAEVVPYHTLHMMGEDFYLPCIEDPALDCTGSTHAYNSCILPFCDYTVKRGPTFHNRVPHDWSVGWEGQTCTVCGRVEMFD